MVYYYRLILIVSQISNIKQYVLILFVFREYSDKTLGMELDMFNLYRANVECCQEILKMKQKQGKDLICKLEAATEKTDRKFHVSQLCPKSSLYFLDILQKSEK